MRRYLVVIDCQDDFIHGPLGSAEAKSVIPNIKSKIDNFDGCKIFATRDTHYKNYLNTMEGKALPIVHCISGTTGWEIEKGIHTAMVDYINRVNDGECCIIDKYAFGSESLAQNIYDIHTDYIKHMNGNTGETCEIEIVGLCTDICVITNAILIKTKMNDVAKVIVDAACCAGSTPEMHKAALNVMKSCQIDIINE